MITAQSPAIRDLDSGFAEVREFQRRFIAGSEGMRDETRGANGAAGETRGMDEVNARLAAIVAWSDDAIISKSLDGVIQTWNRGAEKLFGYTAAEAIGQPVTMLIPPERFDEEPSILERIRRGEPIDHYETVRRRKDGSYIDVSLSVSPLVDSRGIVVGASKIARDITERKRAEEALREADRRKNEFLATLAHELRNPLAPIRNSLNVLKLSGSNPLVLAELQEVMERQVNHMVRLVDDLLEISRINTGKIDLRPEPVELASVVRNAIETSRPLIDSARHELTTHLPMTPLTVEGDPVRLSQVVSNLLNNAAKYTPEGGRIEITVRREGNDAVIAVRDSGIGISPAMLGRVFEMFTQVERDRHHSQGGLGIGLALSSLLVGLHGGRIEARSEGEGRGSEFLVWLPLRAGSLQASSGEGATIETPKIAVKVPILVVDDNRDAASSLGMLLRVLKGDVRTANDGPAALRILETFRPRLILLDLGMPGMDGYEVANRIRRMPQLKETVVIALTGWGQEEDRRRTREAGFDGHLTKPVNLDSLQALLQRL